MNDAHDKTVPTYLLVAILASLAILLPFWVVDYLPTHDGPQHILGIYMYHHLHDAGTGYEQFFRHNLPITNLGFTALFASLELILPWRQAVALSLSIIALIWSWGFLSLCRTLHPDRWLVGVVGFAAALQWAMYMGMFSYVLSTGIGFFVIAYALRRSSWSARERLGLGALLTLQAFAHVFGALASGLVLGLMVLVRSPARQRLRELGWLLVLSLPTLAVTLMARTPMKTVSTSGDWLTFTDLLAAPAALFFTGPPFRRWSFTVLFMTGLVWAVIRVIKKQASKEETALLIAAILFLPAGSFLPIHIPGWDYGSLRFLPFGAMFSLALLPTERLIQRSLGERRAVAALAGVLLLSNVAWQTLYSCDLWQRCANALAASEAPLKRSGNRLPIILNPDVGLHAMSMSAMVPFSLPLRNIGPLFALQQGGRVPYFFAEGPTVHPNLLREDVYAQLPKVPSPSYVAPLFMFNQVDPRERATIVNYLLSFGPQHEDVIVSGTPGDLDLAVNRGFVSDFRNDTVLIAHFKGCPAALHVQRTTSQPLSISFGWFPYMEPSQTFTLPAAVDAPTLDLAQVPCGTIWLRVISDADGSGTLTAGDSTCVAAAPDGIFLATLGPQAHTIECPLRPWRQ